MTSRKFIENRIVTIIVIAAVYAFAGYYFGYQAGFQKAANICIDTISNCIDTLANAPRI